MVAPLMICGKRADFQDVSVAAPVDFLDLLGKIGPDRFPKAIQFLEKSICSHLPPSRSFPGPMESPDRSLALSFGLHAYIIVAQVSREMNVR